MSESREKLKEEFLRLHGWADAERFPLQPDASFRSYTRLGKGGKSCMLMDAPPSHENIEAYLAITRHLQALGLRAPAILAEDVVAGFALIEDFGDHTFTRLLRAGEAELPLYLLAADVLACLHGQATASHIQVPAYDMAALMREVTLFTEWFVPAARGEAVTVEEAEAYTSAWQRALKDVAEARQTLVLRDYHVDNLMIVGGEGVSRCGLLDYQDALIGAEAYDLVSLVEDARRDISLEVREAVIDHYCAARPHVDRQALERDMLLLGAQRHAKVAGIFTRLSRRDGKDVYLGHIPRVLALMNRCLQAPELSEVRTVIETMVPDYQQVIIRPLSHKV